MYYGPSPVDFDMGPEVAALRSELRGLIAEHVPPDFLGAFTDDPSDLATAQHFCKVLAERSTGRLLGAHIMGLDASVVIQPLIQAMSFGLTATEMACGQYWIHPALPELLENALLGLRL